MLSIDPTEILSALLGEGLWIPHDAAHDLKVLRKVLRVEKAELNLVERHLILHHFSVGLEGQPDALRIRNVYIQWDSYLRPCLDVMIDGVDILVEFANLLLTRNNWNELKDAGFLPDSLSAGLGDGGFLSFIRFANIDVSGAVDLLLVSKPLKEDIGRFRIDVPATDELKTLIRDLSDKNEVDKSRRGCSPSELNTIFKSHFGRKVRAFLADSLYDATSNPGAAIRGSQELMSQLGGTALTYASRAGRRTTENLEQIIVDKLSDAGLSSPREKFNEMKRKTMETLYKVNSAACRKYEFEPDQSSDESNAEENDRPNLEIEWQDDASSSSDP